MRRSIEAVARGRYLMPVVLSAGIAAMTINEFSYLHSVETLRGGIAMTDARLQAAAMLQLVTDAQGQALASILSASPDPVVAYRERVRQLQETRQAVRGLAGRFPPGLSLADIDAHIAARVRETDHWIDLVGQGQAAAARDLAVERQSIERGQALNGELSALLRAAADIQSQARFSLYNAMAISRTAVHLLALIAMLGLFLFRRQLRESDQHLADEQTRLAARVKERTAELTEMATHLVHAREDERALIARELHDELGGLLTAMKLDFARLWRLPGLPAVLRERLASLETRLNEGIALKRHIIERLRPSALDQLGLVRALEILCRDMAAVLGRPVRADLQPVPVSPDAELTLYRIAQEALTNAGKYARCTQVQLRLAHSGDQVRLRVSDDGQGFDPQAVPHSRHGLMGMRVRLSMHGGHLLVDSAPGRGTTITAVLPAGPGHE